MVLLESKKPDTVSNLLTYYLSSQGKPQTKLLHQQIQIYHPRYDKEEANRCLRCALLAGHGLASIRKNAAVSKAAGRQHEGRQLEERQLEDHVLDYFKKNSSSHGLLRKG